MNFSDNRYFTVNNLMSVVINCRKLQKIEATKLIAVQESSRTKRRLQDEDVKFIINHISPDLHSLILDTSTLTLPTFEVSVLCLIDRKKNSSSDRLSEDFQVFSAGAHWFIWCVESNW